MLSGHRRVHPGRASKRKSCVGSSSLHRSMFSSDVLCHPFGSIMIWVVILHPMIFSSAALPSSCSGLEILTPIPPLTILSMVGSRWCFCLEQVAAPRLRLCDFVGTVCPPVALRSPPLILPRAPPPPLVPPSWRRLSSQVAPRLSSRLPPRLSSRVAPLPEWPLLVLPSGPPLVLPIGCFFLTGPPLVLPIGPC